MASPHHHTVPRISLNFSLYIFHFFFPMTSFTSCIQRDSFLSLVFFFLFYECNLIIIFSGLIIPKNTKIYEMAFFFKCKRVVRASPSIWGANKKFPNLEQNDFKKCRHVNLLSVKMPLNILGYLSRSCLLLFSFGITNMIILRSFDNKYFQFS